MRIYICAARSQTSTFTTNGSAEAVESQRTLNAPRETAGLWSDVGRAEFEIEALASQHDVGALRSRDAASGESETGSEVT